MINKRYIQAKQLLFVAINELDKGASPMEAVDAIEEFVLAAISDAFNKHPVTKGAFDKPAVSASGSGVGSDHG